VPTNATNNLDIPIRFLNTPTLSRESIRVIATGTKLPGLTSTELSLLRRKQKQLASNASTILDTCSSPYIRKALTATLIFAQHQAGTAACIDETGLILTCAHCFGDDEEEYQASSKMRWMLFYTGLAVQVECRVWDAKRDLALLRVIAIESSEGVEGYCPMFTFVTLSNATPSYKMPIICIGQPGREDLESSTYRRTKYNLMEISKGKFRGMVDGDPQDNSIIGKLMHDAWTYWGHSGAPLIREADGTLIGLHSSWDDQTSMRHGIPQAAIRGFLEQQNLLSTGSSSAAKPIEIID
jgi:hypothetical protein